MKRKWILGIITIIVLVVVGGLYYYMKSSPAAGVVGQTATVSRGDAISTVSATGTIKPFNSVEISSKITALIKQIPVKENQSVKAGEVLVVLEDKELATRLDQARYKLTSSEAKYKRASYLHSIGAKSEQDLEDARLEYETATSSMVGVQYNIDDTIILSPMDGVVVGEPKTVGTLVAQGVNNPTVIMIIADLSKKLINAKVDETDIGKVKVGQKATFKVDAYTNRTFEATVKNISQTDVDNSWSKTNTSSSTSVVYYSVTLDVEDPENLLKPAMTARVDIKVSEKQGVLLVPLAALKTSSTKQHVAVLRPNGTMEDVTVKTGVYTSDKVEIIEGVAEGDQLIISYNKKDKDKVQLRHPGGKPPI